MLRPGRTLLLAAAVAAVLAGNAYAHPGLGTAGALGSAPSARGVASLSAETMLGGVGVSCYGRVPTITGTEAGEEILGTDGPDVIAALGGDDVIRGLGGRDLICPGEGNDEAYGGAALDNLEASPGDDLIDGGPGQDFVGHYDSPAPVVVDLAAGTSTGWGSDTLASVEGVVGSLFADEIFGRSGPDQLEGRAGADLIDGRGGHDLLYGDAGSDRFRGGKGFDYVSYWTSPRGVRADLSRGRATGDGTDTFRQIEGLGGSRFADVLIGNRRTNGLYGEPGNDRLLGLGGRDGLFGNAGRDRLDGGAGYDLGNGGRGTDTCVRIEVRRSCP